MEKLKDLFYGEKTGYIGLKQLYEKSKELNLGLTYKKVQEFYRNQEINQVYKKPKIIKNKLKITAPPNSYQIDVMFFTKYKSTDKALLLIEITSRKAYGYILKSNNTTEILDKLTDFKKSNNIYRLEGDKQFDTKLIQDYCKEHNIQTDFQSSKDDHITKTGNRLGLIDRFTRTLKSKLNKWMSLNDKLNWISVFDSFIENYNKTLHTTTNMKPVDLDNNKLKMLDIHNNISKQNIDNLNKITSYSIGDRVRVINTKTQFQKEGEQFSRDIYVIENIQGNKYKVNSKSKLYKPNELQKVNINETISQSKPITLPKNTIQKQIDKDKVIKKLRKEGIDFSNYIRDKSPT